ncbi:MAG: hypothetical protein UR66_C0006G0072 [Candidatus Moranbacteria bacterium GW2011_GWE1_35_17]|nr:MAG: hypothetical protein UR66_C0006G0072 [Candidatus Moranbacteria bacterium GW2011_GWE1_35_17]KKP82138.1 MAG: hypothetical protein UR82_C0043G0009 [Candidatus Moranbacteria bacterium GW2011_GWF1_35_5]
MPSKPSNKLNTNDIAISVKNVSKTFKIPHEKITSVKGAVTSLFKSGGYEEFKALDNVSFEVKKGEFFACLARLAESKRGGRRGIIGRNGSGKSTLLKINISILTELYLFANIEVSKTTRSDSFLGHGGFLF